MSISCIPARPRDAVADAVARLVDSSTLGTWSGSPADLYKALDLVTTADERQAFAWPRTAAALAARLPSLLDPLWAHGLRVTRHAGDLIIERVRGAA